MNFRGTLFEALFPIGGRAEWKFLFGRSAIGGGSSFVISTASYTYKIVCAFFGVLLWLPKEHKRNQYLNIGMVCLTFPFYFLQGTRHSLIEVVGPAFLTFFLIHPMNFKKKIVFGILALLIMDFLLGLMIAYRNTGFGALLAGDINPVANESMEGSRHEGLNMFEELCYINRFQHDGLYPIQYGEEYLAEIAQVVPRTFWPGKPTIALDYALARGFHSRHTVHGVSATISLGIIGQGVANFGIVVGAIFASILAAVWCGFLSRLRYQSSSLLRLCLYIAAIGFTINLGRGFSLLVLWPVVFGFFLVKFLEATVLKRSGEDQSGYSRRSSQALQAA